MIGRIVYVITPKDNLFFSDIEHVFFKIIDFKNEEYYCSGKSMFVKKDMLVNLEGIVKNDIFYFNKINVVLDDTLTQETFLKYVLTERKYQELLGKSSTEKIFKFLSNSPINFIKRNNLKNIIKIDHLMILLKHLRIFKINEDIDELNSEQKNKLLNLTIKDINKCLLNPFLLEERLNFSFLTCTKLLKKEINEQLVVKASIYDILKNNFYSGNTIMREIDLVERIKKNVKFVSNAKKLNIENIYADEIKKGELVKVNEYVMGKKNYLDITFLNKKILSLSRKDKNVTLSEDDILFFQKERKMTLGEEQIQAVKSSVTNNLSIITGGPGTGKTTILSCVLTLLSNFYKKEDIALCSPTGKASLRMEESTGFKASTIHTLLRVIPNSDEHANDFSFYFNESNKLPYKLIVIDESSMIDQQLAVNFFKAVNNDTHIIFVGDINQLPPVGAGYFFRDLIKMNVPCVKLIKTYRQGSDSTIIKLAKGIQNGRIDEINNAKDFGFKTLNNVDEIIDIYLRGVKERGIENIEILCPQNNTPLGTRNLNNLILNKLIPNKENEIRINSFCFREGARVIQTKNDYSLGIVNGQLGTITKIDRHKKIVTINYDNKEYLYNPGQMENLALGYAITIHKSQGSERKYVIQVCSSIHKMNTKSLVYTGITRAKEKLIIVGDRATFLASPKKEPKEVLSFI